MPSNKEMKEDIHQDMMDTMDVRAWKLINSWTDDELKRMWEEMRDEQKVLH